MVINVNPGTQASALGAGSIFSRTPSVFTAFAPIVLQTPPSANALPIAHAEIHSPAKRFPPAVRSTLGRCKHLSKAPWSPFSEDWIHEASAHSWQVPERRSAQTRMVASRRLCKFSLKKRDRQHRCPGRACTPRTRLGPHFGTAATGASEDESQEES